MKALRILSALLLTLTGCNHPASDTPNLRRATKAPVPLATSPRSADIAATRANFSSLKFDANLGTTKCKTRVRMRVENGRLTVSTRDGRKYTAPFSRVELDELLKILNNAKFPTLSGNYMQPRIYDDIYETVSLSLHGNGKDEEILVFTVNNYGNHAPPTYKSVSHFLYLLREHKFPAATFESISA